MNRSQLKKVLIEKGINLIDPENVHIEGNVDPDRICGRDIFIYPGCRISGAKTLIMDGVRLGQEGPATLEDCQIGPNVELKGGYFKKSVFHNGANMAFGAHVRDACILEEEANCAHSVGLKQTILFPFVTLGSLINFCDCLMAGGTSRKDHSEVGSSYIHFNYTPNQDKATASLIGDVARGVMLDQRPIFLGGQGGLVGPATVGYGSVIAAGMILRSDVIEENRLVSGMIPSYAEDKYFIPGLLGYIKGKVSKNISYIANLIALKAWYLHVRYCFANSEPLYTGLLQGSVEKLDMAFEERVSRLKAFINMIPESLRLREALSNKSLLSESIIEQQKELYQNWVRIEDKIRSYRDYSGNDNDRDEFMSAIRMQQPKSDYIKTIKSMDGLARKKGTLWLGRIVSKIQSDVLEHLTSFK